MAIKFFCDGCDMQIYEPHMHVVTWRPIATAESTRQLCDGCFERFDPIKWPRRPQPSPK